ncbi:MAG TPA: Uma2 family endonuclease [Blastocatellia bacterium]
MSLRKSDAGVSVTNYLEGERESPIRHEYVGGHVYAMAGASDRHNRISLNFAGWLNDNLGTGPGETFMSDMKIRVDEKTYYYPDVVVSCEEHPPDPYFRSEPVLIIEVTSAATTRTDQHEKKLAYRAVTTLKEYVLVSQDQLRVEIHRRSGDAWVEQILTDGDDTLRLESVGLSMTLKEIYRNVRFDQAG